MIYIFTLEGSYASVLKGIHDMETKRNLGSVAHLGLEKKKDYRTKRTYLQTKVFWNR